ncbi:MAG: RnfH family protein, partial [Gammaproteobacteria bacterium]|nr:RnfH family protein [Gammaproteobacteria bacterium]
KYLVEVVYALPDEQALVALDVEQGTTAEQAVRLSGLLEKYSDIDLEKNKLGIFGKVVNSDQLLRHKDRVEIYRPLIADPKESRRKRADKKEAKGTK